MLERGWWVITPPTDKEGEEKEEAEVEEELVVEEEEVVADAEIEEEVEELPRRGEGPGCCTKWWCFCWRCGVVEVVVVGWCCCCCGCGWWW